MIIIRKFNIDSKKSQRVTWIPAITYQNTEYWFHQTRRDWKLDLLLPFDYQHQKSHPVVLWLSGGSWQMMDRSAYLPELVYLAKAGYVVASIDYHMGSEAAFPKGIQDVRQALDYLKSQKNIYQLDMNRVTLMGDSAGGHLALLTAYTMNQRQLQDCDLGPATVIQQVVAYYAPTNLQRLKQFYDRTIPKVEQFDYIAPLDFLLRQQPASEKNLLLASPSYYVRSGLPRTLLLQGDADQWVPLEQATTLVSKLQAYHNPVEIFELAQGTHIDERFFDPVLKKAVLAFMNQI